MKVMSLTRIGIMIFCLVMGIALWIVVPSYFFIVQNCSFTLDTCFSEALKNDIGQWAQEKFLKKSFHSLPMSALKLKFPVVDTVSIGYRLDGTVHCAVRALRPLVVINQQYLMMDDGQLTNKDFFSCVVVDSLPSITVKYNDNLQLSSVFQACIQGMPDAFFDRYIITWIDHTMIEFRDKNNPEFFMLAQYQTDFNDRLIDNYEQIKHQIMSQHSYVKKQWSIDVRFKNQSIVAQKNAGAS